MKKIFLSACLSTLIFSTATEADEQIQLAAAIGMPPTTQSSSDETGDGRTTSSEPGSGPLAGLSKRAMIGIGIGAAVLIGVVSSGSSDSTPSH